MSDETPQRASEPEVTGNLEKCWPEPTPEQLAHTAARIREAQARAVACRQELGITGEATTTDVWSLARSLEEGGEVRVRHGDVDGGRVVHWPERPKSITLPQSPASPEAEAEELLLLLGFALCAGPEHGFDYETLQAAGTLEPLTRPVAEAFREAFQGTMPAEQPR